MGHSVSLGVCLGVASGAGAKWRFIHRVVVWFYIKMSICCLLAKRVLPDVHSGYYDRPYAEYDVIVNARRERVWGEMSLLFCVGDVF
jgi:hypothetical protein